MRKLLSVALLISLLSAGAARAVSDDEVLKRLKVLEKKVAELEKENRELKRLLKRKGYSISSRKNTENLKVEGRVLFRFSQTEDIDDAGKSVYGDSGNGFAIRKARLKVSGKLSDNSYFLIHIRADRGSNVELWDAYLGYRFDGLPISVKLGQFKVPLSMSYLKSGTKLWLPERPVAVNRIAPVWRDVGIEVSYKPMKNLNFAASILNGEGWETGKIYNQDKKYLYVFAVDATPYSSEYFSWRIRAGYEVGWDASPKLVYSSYGVSSVKRHLFDLETSLNFRNLGLAFEGGYLHDNPTGSPVSLGDSQGFYLQGDYSFPFIKGLHLVGRYSWVDPNDDVDDQNDVDYTTIGFYYLLNGWQAAVRSAYVWANERYGEEIDNNLFVTEFQLLF